MLQQTFAQVSEVPVGITLRRDSFVHLDDVHALPRHVFFSEIAKHDPRGFAPTHGHDKLAATCNRDSCFFSEELRSCECDGVGIGIDFDLHQAASLATANALFSSGLLQPPGGVTSSTSCGPQVLGAYG